MPKQIHAIPSATETGRSRRGTLLTLSGAALAAIANLSIARAGNGSRKDRKRASKQADKLCKRQGDPCRAVYSTLCDDIPRASCTEVRDAILACCDHLEDCQAGEALTCILAASASFEDRIRFGLGPQ